jgi:hypothetical protein
VLHPALHAVFVAVALTSVALVVAGLVMPGRSHFRQAADGF